MLPFRSRWQFAANGIPAGEARLLWFAERADEPKTPDDTPEPPRDPSQVLAEGLVPPEGRQEVIDQQQREARERAAQALERAGGHGGGGAEAHPRNERLQHAEHVLHQAKEVEEKLEGMHTLMAGLHDAAHLLKQENPAKYESWLQIEQFVREHLQEMKLMSATAAEITEWEKGNRSPHQLRAYLEQINQPSAEALQASRQPDEAGRAAREQQYSRETVLNAIQSKILESGGTELDATDLGRDAQDAWETRNHSTRAGIVTAINGGALRGGDGTGTIGDYLELLLRDIELRTETMNSALRAHVWKENDQEETVESFVARIGKALKEAKTGDGKLLGAKRGIFESIGIKFYSPMEVLEAFNKVTDAYISAYKQRSSLRTDVLAQRIGGIAKHLPWGGRDVPHTLDSHLDEANDKVKSHHIEYLKRRNASFIECFGPHGELAHNAHDGNIARGVLEYAASRGWLYDIDLDSKSAEGYLTIHDSEGNGYSLHDLVPRDWDRTKILDYQSVLLTQQNKGKKEEADKYYNRYYNKNRAEDFVELADEEMRNTNLWAVKGIIKRSFERGLRGEVSPWMTTTLFKHLESSPLIRRVATLDWLDQIGQEALYASYFTTGFFKAERGEILEWIKKGDANNLSQAGMMGTTIAKIRHEIGERTGKHWEHLSDADKTKMNHNIAKILAGQLVTIDGEKFTIFGHHYDDYRNSKLITDLGELRPGVKDEDPDYFTNRSENRFASVEIIKQIFERSGQGSFKHEAKLGPYTADVITMYDELASSGMGHEAESYRKEMGRKLSEWILDPLGDSRSPGLEVRPMKGPPDLDGKPIIGTLIQRGFIDIRYVIDQYVKGGGGEILARNLLQQNGAMMGHNLFDELTRAKADSRNRAQVEEITARWAGLLPRVTWDPPLKLSSRPKGQERRGQHEEEEEGH